MKGTKMQIFLRFSGAFLILGFIYLIAFYSKGEPGDALASFLENIVKSWPLAITIAFFIFKSQIISLLERVTSDLTELLEAWQGRSAKQGLTKTSESYEDGSSVGSTIGDEN